jgi:hypothetical protein
MKRQVANQVQQQSAAATAHGTDLIRPALNWWAASTTSSDLPAFDGKEKVYGSIP